MSLITKTVHSLTTTWSDIKDLYLEAFPAVEHLPLWLLYAQSLRPSVTFLVYYDGDQLAGMSYIITSDYYAFVLYLAVNSRARGRGYGSQILTNLKQSYAEKEIVLNIEPLDDEADNTQQRRKRLAFYEKNGMYPTAYQLIQAGQVFTVLSQSGHLHSEKLLALLNKFSLGLVRLDLVKSPSTRKETT